ncbi:peptide ABC transporter substrate-binding protein [Aestuariispira insulae]|uniref:Peptide/nickel transport system substrate-binding protein n=1 Tax=Aestuariispira insulae TaxID=1461337 RepID=A0A3D9HIA8_9PROT|nr:peptide ABC transporter substrate-binding protein [Aestuariispira insulae]RED49198.1 peptide/nickel transport system substrate-binding protein [Aestuariispira insulae]
MRWIQLTCLLLTFIISGTAWAENKRLVIGISQYPGSLHPAYDSMMAKSYILGMTRRPISVYDANWEDVCLLCTELPDFDKGTAKYVVTESGKEGIAVTYSLDPKAVWGDGTPITTRDVMFTWEVGANPESGIDNFEFYRRIEKIEVIDDKTFTLVMNRRSCDYQGIPGFTLLPSHVDRPYSDDPREYQNRTLYEKDPTNPALWYGPYRVSNVQNGQSITLVRNERWWGKKPWFDEIEIRAIENTAALTANLLSGDIDMIAGESGLTTDQALAFERRHGDDFQFIYKQGLVYEHIDLMLENPILADVRVRRALLQGIDRDAISQQLFAGKQPVAHGSVNPLDSVYNPDAPRYDFDPEAASRLLEEAGWTLASDGVRRNAEGEKLQLELMTTAGNKTRELVEQVLQSQWKKIGVDVRIRNEPARVFFGETVSKRKFTGMAMFAWFSSPKHIPLTTLKSDQIPNEENNWAGQNYTGYAKPEMDQLIEDMDLKCEADQNQAAWDRMQELYATDLPVLPLYYRANPYILPKDLKGLVPTGHQYPSTLWVENWHRAP